MDRKKILEGLKALREWSEKQHDERLSSISDESIRNNKHRNAWFTNVYGYMQIAQRAGFLDQKLILKVAAFKKRFIKDKQGHNWTTRKHIEEMNNYLDESIEKLEQ
jgi:hypothetical protein